MKVLFDYCLRGEKIPPNWKESRVTLYLKEGKSPADPGSYRPIALPNVEYKILSGILAECLNLIIGKLHRRQPDGIYARTIYEGQYTKINVMNRVPIDHTPPVFAFLDAEKAFDRIEWRYRRETIRHFGIGHYFSNWLDLLYAGQVVRIYMEGYCTTNLKINRGVRQGC